MGYVDAFIQSNMRHDDNNSDFLEKEILRYSIWYSSTQESYVQRDSSYDETWLYSTTSDNYLLIALKSMFSLNQILIFEDCNKCHEFIDSIDKNRMDSIMVLYKKNNVSLYKAFVESIRNGFAHGTFNRYKTGFFIANQHKPKKDSPFKFYLLSVKSVNVLRDFFSLCQSLRMNDLEARYRCMREEFQIEYIGQKQYSKKYLEEIIIDDEFKFSTSKHVDELAELIKKYEGQGKKVVIISENLGNTSAKNLTSLDHEVRIISQSKLIEYFDLKDIIFVQKDQS